jgi:hypothetical protein
MARKKRSRPPPAASNGKHYTKNKRKKLKPRRSQARGAPKQRPAKKRRKIGTRYKKPCPPPPSLPEDSNARATIVTPHSGRPSKYSKEIIPLVKRYYEAGLIDMQICCLLNIDPSTWWKWKIKYPELLKSLKGSRKFSDENVEASLYARATGYSHPDLHVSQHEGQVTLTRIVKHYPPDPVSAIFWLKNRMPRIYKSDLELAKAETGETSAEIIEALAKGADAIAQLDTASS